MIEFRSLPEAIAESLADYVFEPTMQPSGMLAGVLGGIFGTGEGSVPGSAIYFVFPFWGARSRFVVICFRFCGMWRKLSLIMKPPSPIKLILP